MVSPFQGTPNMPLQLDSMTNSCVPSSRASGGMMYSTLRSPPYPPVMPLKELEYVHDRDLDDVPCSGVPSTVYIIASQPGSNSTVKIG